MDINLPVSLRQVWVHIERLRAEGASNADPARVATESCIRTVQLTLTLPSTGCSDFAGLLKRGAATLYLAQWAVLQRPCAALQHYNPHLGNAGLSLRLTLSGERRSKHRSDSTRVFAVQRASPLSGATGASAALAARQHIRASSFTFGALLGCQGRTGLRAGAGTCHATSVRRSCALVLRDPRRELLQTRCAELGQKRTELMLLLLC